MTEREAILRIKPKLVGPKNPLAPLRNESRKTSDSLVRGFARGRHEVMRLDRAFDVAARGASTLRQETSGLLSGLGSLKGLAMGVAAGGAGKTIFDGLIGSNAELEKQRITFETMMGSAELAGEMLGRINKFATSTPFAQGDLIDGSKRLLRLTKENVSENERLLKVAAQMAAINPDKSVSDAVEAILDAEGLEFERLKEFGLKLKRDDIKKMKKRGEKMGQAALRGVVDALNKQTGGRDVVKALSTSFSGQVSTLKDNVRNTLRVAGEPAFEVFREGIGEVSKDLEKLQADPQFKQDLKDLSVFAKDLAKSSLELTRSLPGAIKDARAFYNEHETAITYGGGALLANKFTGGLLGRGAGAAGRGLLAGGRKLLGRRGGAAQAAGGALGAAGALPVYVVNMGEGGMGGSEFFGRAGLGAGGAAGGTGLGAGGAAAGGALAAGAGALVVGTFLGALGTLAYATNKTSEALKNYEKTTLDATKRQAFDAKTPYQTKVINENLRRIMSAKRGSSGAAFKGSVLAAFGGADAKFTGSAFQTEQLEALNVMLRKQGLEFQVGKGQTIGQGTFTGGGDTLRRDKASRRQLDKLAEIRGRLTGPNGEKLQAELRQSGTLDHILAVDQRLKSVAKGGAAEAAHLNQIDARTEVGELHVHVGAESMVDAAKIAADIKRELAAIERDEAELQKLLSPGG